MKIPKKIDTLLNQRTRYAGMLDRVSFRLDKWLMEHGIDPGDANWMTGCEIYVNPYAAEAAVRKAIVDHDAD